MNPLPRLLPVLILLAAGCDDMARQPRQSVYAPAASPAAVPADTVEFRAAAGPTVPPLTLALLERGRERFHIDCAPCHSELGDGRGMIVQRGFPPPPSYHIDRLRDAPPAYIVQVITEGHGAMYSFAERVQPQDRWAIAAYVKALQRSQHASLADLPPAARASLP
jgi:mono/diheme cytochrome c family protein